MNKKTLTTIFAVIGALAAIGALLYVFRDKLAALCKKDCCCCDDDDDFVDDAKEAVNEAVEDAKQAIADQVEDAKEAITEHAEKAAAIADEFKDYAD